MVGNNKKINVGIGFVTGRKNFKSVAKTYVNNWNESGAIDNKNYALHLFVAYDLAYKSTKVYDYRIADEEILDTVDSSHYIGQAGVETEVLHLIENKVIDRKEASLIFGEGYAMKRNTVMYFALKNKMDYLIFLDDDEYPVATIKVNDSIVWKGQEVLSTHIENLKYCDMTNGHHCGYISPIPCLNFTELLTEADFKLYIESISNDIINWESIKSKMKDGGVTYASLDTIESSKIETVEEKSGMKFITGANLGFNLKNKEKIFPFYNPPGARGEDTFLSTCLKDCTIRKIPCYTFHDGFSTCEHLLLGVLPNELKAMSIQSNSIIKRFLQASIGWIRYKPLFLYILDPAGYSGEIQKIRGNLLKVLPSVCACFGNEKFQNIISELDYYDAHVMEHFRDFENTKKAWIKIVKYLEAGKN